MTPDSDTDPGPGTSPDSPASSAPESRPGSSPVGPPGPSNPALTLAQVQAHVFDRYFPTDSARGAEGTFLLFMEEVGELATALHDTRPGKDPSPEVVANMAEEFADVLAWLTTLANIRGIDLTEAWTKYTDPGRVEGVKD